MFLRAQRIVLSILIVLAYPGVLHSQESVSIHPALTNGSQPFNHLQPDQSPETSARLSLLKVLNDEYVVQEELCEYWETTNNAWFLDDWIQYSYNSSGQLDTSYTQTWWNELWNDIFRTVFYYDEDGLLTESVFESTLETGSWQNVSRQVRLRDLQDRDSINTTQLWDNNEWENSSRQHLTYDTDGRLMESLVEIWEDFDDTWNIQSLIEYSYDGSTTNYTDIVTYSWNGSQWNNASRNVYAYNANDDFEEILIQIWDFNDWFNQVRFGYTYDENGYLIELAHQQWDHVSTWNDFIRTDYTNDENGLQILRHKLFWVSNAWISDSRCTTTWQMLVTDIDKPENPVPHDFSLSNYPNPFNPGTVVKLRLAAASEITMNVYDLSGRKVSGLLEGEKLTAGLHEVAWDGTSDSGVDVASGTYFVTVRTETSSLTKKMLLVR